MYRRTQILVIFLMLLGAFGILNAPVAAEKMKPEDVVAKHVAAIGPADAVAAAKTRVVVGEVKAISKSSAVRDIAGVAQLASERDKVVLAMIFNSTGYPFEKAGFDGDKMTVGLWETTGRRSALAEFLMAQQTVFKEGLIGGTLSAAWRLLDLAAKNPKLGYSGTKKINERQVHVLKYRPNKGGGDLQINLFFDAETFHHVRTEYSYSITATMGRKPQESVMTAPTNTGSPMDRYKLIEEFSDFKPEGQLILPHVYKLSLIVEAQRSLQVEWITNFTQFGFDQPIEAKALTSPSVNKVIALRYNFMDHHAALNRGMVLSVAVPERCEAWNPKRVCGPAPSVAGRLPIETNLTVAGALLSKIS